VLGAFVAVAERLSLDSFRRTVSRAGDPMTEGSQAG
jgi:hypothetical protein